MQKVDLCPLDDRVLIRQLKAEERTEGGLFIPDNAKEKPCRGEVLAVGPGRLLEDGSRAALQVCIGDIIVYDKYAEVAVKANGEDCLMVCEGHILAREIKNV